MVPASVYAQRRVQLWTSVTEKTQKPVAIVVFAALEGSRTSFWQDSNFFYLTGIQEPGWVLLIDHHGVSHLYMPQTTIDRSVWLQVTNHDELDALSGPYQWHSLGEPDASYSLSWYTPKIVYKQLLADLKKLLKQGVCLSALQRASNAYLNQREFVHKIGAWLGIESDDFYDCTDQIAHMRRTKDSHELAAIKQAIAITNEAQQAAAQVCKPGVTEASVKAALEAVMTGYGALPAFPSIVATGVHGTILHYTGSAGVLQEGDMLVVDIGASWYQYAADITRTYAVSGHRSSRQEELYRCILAVQHEIAQFARPGIWLRNSDHPEASLQHRAVELFKKEGLDHYFVHGIGHYLGLDVHDVGSYEEPLRPGDVITIEPGLYLRDEAIGIRIEDNYLITEHGTECLSSIIPK